MGGAGAGRRRVDLLINNAAVVNRNAPLWEITDREFSEVVRRQHLGRPT